MYLKWLGITICIMHSALFSGLNLGFFGLSRLKLEVQADLNNSDAQRILNLRKDAHFMLSTLLWGNVAANVLLALLSESVLTGVGAFFFSTVGITMFGEVLPQAYLSRNALKTSVILVPVVRFYQVILFPLAKPTAQLLDWWLGKERVGYFQEEELMHILKKHAHSEDADIEHLETQGAMNFLELDDIKLRDEGETINPLSIIKLEVNENGLPLFPEYERDPNDPFLQQVHMSHEKWVILTDDKEKPLLVLNADDFLRDVMYADEVKSIYTYCHRPIVITQSGTRLGDVIFKLKVRAEHKEDDVIDDDLILYWKKNKRIITGAEILGRLLRGIVNRVEQVPTKRSITGR